MALTVDEQKLLDFALAGLPDWFTHDVRRLEDLAAAAKCIGQAQATIKYWLGQTLIMQATGPVGDDPDWLNQHAMDRNTRRQGGESDSALRERLRNVPDAITRQSILDAVNAILDAEGITDPAGMVELPRSVAHFGDYTSDSGVGGVFTDPAGTAMRFEPTAGYAGPPFRDVYPDFVHNLELATCEDAANNGTFEVTALHDDAAEYVNGTGIANAADSTVAWAVRKVDVDGNLLDGWSRAYFGRGYRMGRSSPATIVIILPFTATASTEASVREMLRQKKAAGMLGVVERRLIP